MQAIVAPTNCPSCDSTLEWRNDVLYCVNSACASKVQKSIEHFAKTLKIKGLGPSTITKLELTDIDEIYTLSEEELKVKLGSEKIAEKLYSEIQKSKSSSLNVLLPAFNIPLIGNTAAEKLSQVAESIGDLNTEVCKQAGLGPKATENLLTWLRRDFYSFYDGSLPFDFRFAKKVKSKTRGVVCISGKLTSYKTKAVATEALTDAGFEVKSTVTKDVTILVNESGIESSKTQKAREAGVTIVTNLSEFLGDL